MSEPEAPTTAVQDRNYLGLDIPEYRKFAEAVSTQCFINRDGQPCKLKNAKLKKLKNIRYTIKKSSLHTKSLIWTDQRRRRDAEIQKRQHQGGRKIR